MAFLRVNVPDRRAWNLMAANAVVLVILGAWLGFSIEPLKVLQATAGPAALLESHRPALDAIARHVFHVGTEAGQGQALKLLNNFLSATATAATGEAVLFGLSQGLDMTMILDVVNVSTGRSHASADKYVNRVLSGTFDSGFATSLMAKDVRLFSEAAGAAGTAHDIGATVRALWDAMEDRLPDSDHTEVFTFLRNDRLPDG